MPELSDDVVAEARRLARLARDASEDAAADAYRDRLDELLAEHDRVARVRDADARFDSRSAAVAGAVDLAERFAEGDVDYRAAYQVPREAYLDGLDDLTGREA